jgi:tetratricopeptide (TPR) repeat protein
VPPKRLPNNLSADDYFLLGVQYLLLGSMRPSLKALTRAVAGHSAYGKQFISLYCARSGAKLSGFKLNRVQYFLVWLALSGVDVFIEIVLPASKTVWKTAAATSNFFQSAVNLFGKKDSSKMEAEIDTDVDNLTAAIARATVPEGLTPEEYLKLGKQYKQNGWIGQAQEALERVQRLAPGSRTATDAELYLKTKVPRVHVSVAVEQKNIEGYHAMSKGNLQKSREVFEGLMDEYPEFEWPYLNLATAYYKDRQLDKAKFLLRKLLSINPDHVEAWDVLARIHAAEFDIPEAQEAISKALELYPDDTQLKTMIDCLAAL